MGPSHSDKSSICTDVDLLEEAAERNQSIELQHEEPSGEVQTVKTRFLGMDSRFIYLDLPTSHGKPVKLRSNLVVEAYTWVNRQVYSFRSTVVRNDYPIEINSNQRVRGVQITKPSEIVPSQRRNNYRVSMASMAPVDVAIHEAGPVNPGTAPCQARRALARLVNVSTGGCAVVLPIDSIPEVRSGDLVYLHFALEADPRPFIFQAKISQIAEVLNGKATRFGLQFLEWPNPIQFGRMMRPLERFIADAQRAMARRISPRRD